MSSIRPTLPSFNRKPAGDPAMEAAQLLRRIGFAILVTLLPISAVVARRAIVVLAPLGAALLLLATIIESEGREPTSRLRSALLAPPAWPIAFLIFWAGLSLLWTPFLYEAAERLARIVGMTLLAVAAAASVPTRMRASNLWLLPIGVGMAAALLLGVGLFETARLSDGDGEGAPLIRSVAGLLMLSFPAFGWIAIRRRHVWTVALATLVGVAVLVVGDRAVVAAAALGAVALALTHVARPWGVRITRAALAGALLLAPLLPFLLRPLVKEVFGVLDPVTNSIRIWATVVSSEPWRLITGHGLETALRGQFVGMLPVGAPRSLLFTLWYELGVLGAVAAAAALWLAVTAAQKLGPALAPCLVGAIVCGFALAVFGVFSGQTWALTNLSVLAIGFVAVANGQFRTTRPRARFAGS